ncbi:MAG: class I SAM-dependent methyltransferase [Planctomycetes bacterium]|nr:class I SAM-dependent methyltransferase [Planctomycetota bacterium]
MTPKSIVRRRSGWQAAKDAVAFPLRAVTLFQDDRWGLSSLASERFGYVALFVGGECLDVGCGPHNRLVTEWLGGAGKGIDVFAYEGLTDEHIVEDITHFPFPDESFMTVTFIANLNHVPRPLRDVELAEAHRVLAPGGNIVVTMGNPVAEVLVHKVVAVYDRLFGTHHDMDSQRGMEEEEEYYLLDCEIRERLARAGFSDVRKKYFWTQWALNHLLEAAKPG